MGKSVAKILFLTIYYHYKILEISVLKSRMAANAFFILSNNPTLVFLSIFCIIIFLTNK